MNLIDEFAQDVKAAWDEFMESFVQSVETGLHLIFAFPVYVVCAIPFAIWYFVKGRKLRKELEENG